MKLIQEKALANRLLYCSYANALYACILWSI